MHRAGATYADRAGHGPVRVDATGAGRPFKAGVCEQLASDERLGLLRSQFTGLGGNHRRKSRQCKDLSPHDPPRPFLTKYYPNFLINSLPYWAVPMTGQAAILIN